MPRLISKLSLRNLLIFTLVLSVPLMLWRSRVSEAANAPKETKRPATVPLRDQVDIHSAQRGRPWINLADGRQPQVGDTGEASAMSSGGAALQPRAEVSADFNGDGFDDLVVGYATGSAGTIALYQANPEALGPRLPETQQAVANSNFPSPFLSQTKTFPTPVAADFMATGDFNSDGYKDLVISARGGKLLTFLIGDGQGNFVRTESIDLPGNVTAMTAANTGVWKSGSDVLIGISGPQGPELLIYSDPTEVWSANPTSLALPANATAITAGNLEKRSIPDVIVAAGNQLLIAHQAEDSTLQLENVPLSFAATSVQVGHFVWDRENRNDLAVLAADGAVHIMNDGDIDQRPYSAQELAAIRHHREMYRFDSDKTRMNAFMKSLVQRPANEKVWKDSATIQTSLGYAANTQQMIASNLSNGETEDLLLVDPANSRLRIVLGEQGAVKMDKARQLEQTRSLSTRPESVTLDASAAPIAAIPMKVNLGTRNGLVVLQQGNSSPIVMPAAPLATFPVTKTADTADGTCNADCSLREAIIASNATAGPNQINVPAGTYTLSLSSGPLQGDAHTFDNEFLFCGGYVPGGGDLDIVTNDVTITGTGVTPIIQPGTTASTNGADGNGIDRVLNVNDCGSPTGLPVSVTLSNLTLKNGKAPSVDPDNNPATINDFFEAGGVINFDATNWNTNFIANPTKTLTLTNVTVDHGWAPSEGGGIILLGGALTINGTSTISNNISFHTKGGGIAYDGFTDAVPVRTLSISGATISGNNSAFNPVANFPANASAGGGIWAAGGTGVSITSTNINGANNSDRFGGGLDIESAPTATITGGTISGNTAKVDGGGIWASVVAASAANTPSTLVINNTTINSNTADSDTNNTGNGGGIYVQFGNLTLGNTNAVNINSNSAINGGGVYILWDGNSLHPSPGFAMTNGTIGQTAAGNSAKNNGGGIAVVPGAATTFGTVNLATVTIQANTANSDNTGGGDGGGIYIDSGNINPLNGDTIDSNVANSGTGSGIFMNGGSITASNTVSLNGGNSLNINAGTFTSTSGTLNLTGDFTRASAGTFTHNSGTVNFNGTVTQNINGTATSETFNNFIVNKTGTLATTKTTITTNDLTLTAGTFTAPATLDINGNALLSAGTLTAGTNITAAGNWTNNGATFTPGAGTITFDGAGNQAINGTANPQTFNNFTVNKSANTLSTGGSVNSLSVNNLTMTLGTFTAPATLDINGNTLLTAGTLTAGANITAAGNWTNNGGTFTPGSGLVTFDGATANNLTGTAATQTFNNIAVAKGAGSLTGVASTTTLTLNGGITLTSGTFAAGSITAIGLPGNWTNNGGTFTPGSSNVTFNSSAAGQSINGTAASQQFFTITMNKTGQALNTGGSTVTLDINGNLVLTAGTFTAPATITLAGNFTQATGTTFTPGAGTVTFDGGAAQSIDGTLATKTFFGFAVNKANTLAPAAGTTALDINGDVTLTAGTFSAGTAAAITVAGNWTNNGATFTHNGGTVTFDGGAGQTIDGTTATVFNNFTNSDAGGIAMNNDNTVAGTLALGSSDITVANSKTLSQTSATASTGTSDVIGSVKRTNTSTLATIYTFGNPNNRITTTAGTAPTDITVNLVKAAPNGFAGAVTRTYTITPTGGSGITATLRLHYLDAELNGNTEAALILRRFNGFGWAPYSATASDIVNNWVENNVVHNFSPWTLSSCCSPTAGDGAISGRVTTSDGRPVEGAVINLGGDQARKTITDANGNYRFDNVSTGGFYTVTPSRANFNFAPFNRSFSQTGNQTEAVFTARSMGDNANPLDTPEYFVRQQYVDVMAREPEESGFNYWSDQILACGADASCVNRQRRDVAAAFFMAAENQASGSYIYDVYAGTLGRRPAFGEFSVDRQQVVGGATLDAAKAVFAQNFVQRAEFVNRYQGAMTAESFVDALLQTVQPSGVDLSGERANLMAAYNQGADLVSSRAGVVRSLADNATFKQSQYNQAFVLTEYFAYLQRDAEPDGFNFWVNVLNTGDPGNYRGMVCSFVTSAEYQNRFSRIVSHSNGECSRQ